MKKVTLFFMPLAALCATAALLAPAALAGGNGHNSGCTTIQSGQLVDKAGNPISTGSDVYGYDYQAHLFNGYYGNYTRPAVPVTSGDRLIMKWSDAWLANVSCDGDNTLDRGLGTDGAASNTSEGWLTNEFISKYLGADGKVHTYNEFDKIVYTGPHSPLWGDYTLVQQVVNDPYGGYNGVQFKPQDPGFGLNDHWTG